MRLPLAVRSGVLAVIVASSSLMSVLAVPVHAETDCDLLLNDLSGQLEGLDEAVAVALTDINERDTANLDAQSKALDAAMNAWNSATTDAGRAQARDLADQDYAAYVAQLDGLKQEAKDAIAQYRQALEEARAKIQGRRMPEKPPAPVNNGRAMQLTFNGTEQLQQAGRHRRDFDVHPG